MKQQPKEEWERREQLIKDCGVDEWKAQGRSEEQVYGVKNFLTGIGGAKILNLIQSAKDQLNKRLNQEAEKRILRAFDDGVKEGYKEAYKDIAKAQKNFTLVHKSKRTQ